MKCLLVITSFVLFANARFYEHHPRNNRQCCPSFENVDFSDEHRQFGYGKFVGSGDVDSNIIVEAKFRTGLLDKIGGMSLRNSQLFHTWKNSIKTRSTTQRATY